ncbi:MAG TPA: phytanoyl-CoA dioxygenase family protein [Chitinophagaceae bacterium]|nr:phytanoyl-CoA dioxygenase family protein [Chitinophagaceae bacterium]
MEITLSKETGSIGIMHLKRYWQKTMAKREGRLSQKDYEDEWNLDITLLSALGLGLEQTVKYLFLENPAFDQFEQWVLERNGGSIPLEKISNFNQLVASNKQHAKQQATDVVDMDFWNEHGYFIIRSAVPKEDCENTIGLICDFLDIDINNPDTWYRPHPAKQGIMVQLFQHPQLEKNRRSGKIRMAYEQLWGRSDLWMNTDRVSFNPPENEKFTFPGPRLHWDVSLELPIPFGLQGLLYLSDTTAEQGAFTLVPGFQNKIEQWVGSLPVGADPRQQDLYKLGAKPIAANAGDFILWHQALPHGSSPNTSSRPRIVQYINYLPLDAEVKTEWK